MYQLWAPACLLRILPVTAGNQLLILLPMSAADACGRECNQVILSMRDTLS